MANLPPNIVRFATLGDPTWCAPSGQLQLTGDAIHLWRADLGQPPSLTSHFTALLSDDERQRAARLRHETARHNFTIGRGLLRLLLGNYLDCPPQAIRFQYGEHGRPALADHPTLQFNLSHSHQLALYAVTHQRAIGIDLEYIDPALNIQQVARQSFSRREIATLEALPAEVQREAFFRCWTRKEAWIKAQGGGMTIPLDQFDVSLSPGQPAALLATRPDPAESTRWALHNLEVGPEYIAALAVRSMNNHRTPPIPGPPG